MTVLEYMNQFDKLTVRCGVYETDSQQTSRFCLGLKPELRRNLFPYHMKSLEHAYSLAYNFEQRTKEPMGKWFDTSSNESYSYQIQSYEKSLPAQLGQVASRGSNPTVQKPMDKGKAPMTGSSHQSSGSAVCFRCHKQRHFPKQCPTWNLALDKEYGEKKKKEKKETSGETLNIISEKLFEQESQDT
ncbi:uncharacterized protein LOC131143948 [Malania oleifera]|uniref:uncharacterized protein LOC131143948 n=1 Tax=Malania oleifera TaxID=397392 RepID=UPI0025AE7FFE|nr:uncharacterized protein LOC131143948 [Malania oleifera]